MTVIHDLENLEQVALHKMVDFTNQDVLEIGCGAGRLTALYHEKSRLVTGIDHNLDPLQIVRDTMTQNTQFAMADTINLPFRKNSFDIALFSWSL
ncbi:MAG: hypothetical protein Phog2KO_02080 [Phototrophicaceae bacterium]